MLKLFLNILGGSESLAIQNKWEIYEKKMSWGKMLSYLYQPNYQWNVGKYILRHLLKPKVTYMLILLYYKIKPYIFIYLYIFSEEITWEYFPVKREWKPRWNLSFEK